MAPEDAPLQDDPRGYIAEARRRSLASGTDIPDTVTGAALFADISGFTPLTEALSTSLGQKRGAEELVSNLNRILAALINDLHLYSGEVIYFSGDAITCWLTGDDGLRAASCALAMQRTMQEVGEVSVAGDSSVHLSLKVAIAVGSARRFVVGDPQIQLIDVLAGSLIDDLAAAEQVADGGDVVLDTSAVTSLGARAVISETRTFDNRSYGLLQSLVVLGASAPLLEHFEELDDDVAREWLLPTVYERLSSGGGAMFAELRSVFPIFIRFGGIDFDEDPHAPTKLKIFVRAIQHVLDDFGGNLLQLTLGDKGAYLYGVFGSPRAHEDDARRAIKAALQILTIVDSLEVVDLQIGIARGRVLSGTCGHPLRRTFACMGDPVNVAARLMSAAEPGSILASQAVVEAAGPQFLWHESNPLHLKGKAKSVEVSALQGSSENAPRSFARFPLPIVGRVRELSTIRAGFDAALDRNRRVLGITAQPGLGKSRLVEEAIRTIRENGVRVAFGEAEAYGTNSSYLIWRDVWRSLLDLPSLVDEEILGDRIDRLNPTLRKRVPLLSPLLGLDLPDNATTSNFDPKLRKTSLEGLLASLMAAAAADGPIAIVLEDCHWIDEASIDLLEVLVRDAVGLPILFVIAYRAEISETTRRRFHALSSFEEMELCELTNDEMEQAISTKFGHQFGVGMEPAPRVVQLVMDRSEGNPFFIEELINFLHRSGIDASDPDSVGALEIPESLQALVLQRVDSLTALPRRTLKVGSVVGSEFEASSLPIVYPELGDAAEVVGFLETLGSTQLIARNADHRDWWMFRHSVTRDVAYESIPFRLRSELHQSVGVYLESCSDAALPVDLDRLAYHYWNSENREKKIEYQRRAAEAAQEAYANTAAIEYWGRLLSLVDDVDRRHVLTKLGEVLELVGEWDRALEIQTEALGLARSADDDVAVGWSTMALAEIARKQGRYDDAEAMLTEAELIFDTAGDQAGRGRVLHLAGTLASQRGDLDTGRMRYEESLAIRREEDDQAAAASLLSNLGVLAEYTGDLDESERFHLEALEARREVGDRWAIAVSDTNLGMIAALKGDHERARQLFNEAMRLNEEVGDSWMVAVSHNNLGNAHRDLGAVDQARFHYGESARQYLNYGDRWATAFLLEDIAIQASLDGRSSDALTLLGAADGMRIEIDAKRPDVLDEVLERRVVAGSSSEFGADATRTLREAGSRLNFEAAIAAALEHLS